MNSFWIVMGVTGALWFVFLLAEKASRKIRKWEAEDEAFDGWDFGGAADELDQTDAIPMDDRS